LPRRRKGVKKKEKEEKKKAKKEAKKRARRRRKASPQDPRHEDRVCPHPQNRCETGLVRYSQ
jgi:hypothetical protein